MQVNNTGLNFGSIKLSSQASKKPQMELFKYFKELNPNGDVKGFMQKPNEDIFQAAKATREKLAPSNIGLIFNKDKTWTVVAHTAEDEAGMHQKIIREIDSDAHIIDDAPSEFSIKA
ncbi:MAG: hypothetical protein PHE78_01700 [Candidatus Gastranaerophilales bacterium]|jgi:hypothetical protein|nr:hypothetical protein [Candidatus Gastranaerophilales bacterium]